MKPEVRMQKFPLLHSSFLLQTSRIVWHTTGSGKTLTSFKASILLKENDHIHTCVFVVDGKNLDPQTREECRTAGLSQEKSQLITTNG